MGRRANPEKIIRSQIHLPLTLKTWLKAKADEQNVESPAGGLMLGFGGNEVKVKISHLVINAIRFYQANTSLVDGWARGQWIAENGEVRDALTFLRGNRKLAEAYLSSRRPERESTE